MTTEIWKDIIDYEGLYQVSNLGNIKSLKFKKEKILKKIINSAGYYSISLYKDNISKTHNIHQLVAIAFLNHKKCKYKSVIDHIDNNPLNNNINNLRITTQRENVFNKNGKKNGKYSSKYKGVYYIKETNKWHSCIYLNKRNYYLGSFKTEIEAANEYEKKLNQQLNLKQ